MKTNTLANTRPATQVDYAEWANSPLVKETITTDHYKTELCENDKTYVLDYVSERTWQVVAVIDVKLDPKGV